MGINEAVLMDKKNFAIAFVIGFIVLTIYLGSNDVKVAGIIANDGINGIFWYVLSNPAYILLIVSIYMINSEAGYIKNTIGAFMIIFASDVVSYPRLLSTGLPADPSILASSDALVVNKLLSMGFSYSTAHSFYYTVLPIILVVSALAILGKHNFFKTLTGKNA